MKMPRTIRVGHYLLNVTRPREVTWPKEAGGRVVLADYSYAKRTIRVRRGLNGSIGRDLLLHEVLHALWEYNGLHANDSLGRYEERVVTALTSALVEVLRSNPQLVAYLTERDPA